MLEAGEAVEAALAGFAGGRSGAGAERFFLAMMGAPYPDGAGFVGQVGCTMHASSWTWTLLLAAVAATPAVASGLDPLPPCPSTPNCVSTEAPVDDATHYLAPLPLPDGLDPEAALDALEAVIRSEPRTVILGRASLRLTATDRSSVFRFVDDVEARVDPDARVLHARSAARVGRGDLGVNRRRLERWFAQLAETWGVVWPGSR